MASRQDERPNGGKLAGVGAGTFRGRQSTPWSAMAWHRFGHRRPGAADVEEHLTDNRRDSVRPTKAAKR